MSPDLDNIATFIEVGRRGSLSAAAQFLGVPKSTVSRRLTRLEETLDINLVHRDARRVQLTPEGERFFDSAVDAVDAMQLAIARIEDSTRQPRGSIRLTAPGDYGRMVLVPHLLRFLETYPDISLDLIFTNRFVDLIQEGVDVAIRAGRTTQPNLVARKLAPSELQLAARPDVVATCKRIQTLERMPFVLYRARGRTQVIRLHQRGNDQNLDLTVTGRVSVDDYGTMAELVAAGQGVGLMPTLHIDEAEQKKRFVRLFPKWCRQSGHIHLVYPNRKLPERVRVLTNFLQAALTQTS